MISTIIRHRRLKYCFQFNKQLYYHSQEEIKPILLVQLDHLYGYIGPLYSRVDLFLVSL